MCCLIKLLPYFFRRKLAAIVHIHHRHCYYYSTRRLILIYRPTKDERLSRPRHCSKGAQPVPKAVYRSGCHDKRNRPPCDSNLGPHTKFRFIIFTRWRQCSMYYHLIRGSGAQASLPTKKTSRSVYPFSQGTDRLSHSVCKRKSHLCCACDAESERKERRTSQWVAFRCLTNCFRIHCIWHCV